MRGLVKANLLHRVSAGALLAVILACPVFASAGIVNGTNVNVRTAPSPDSPIAGQVHTGDTISVDGTSGDYYNVSFNGINAYIIKEFVDIEQQTTGTVNANLVNIRKYPDVDYEVLAQADYGDTVRVVGRYGEWLNIDYNGESSYIHQDYVDADREVLSRLAEVTPVKPAQETEVATGGYDGYAVVMSDGLRLRSLPSQGADILTTYQNGTAVDVYGDFGDWIKVGLDGTEGYVSREYVSLQDGERPKASLMSAPLITGTEYGGNARADEIISYAKQFLGTPYSWGGTNLNSGVDCSGFVYAVMKHFGVNLSHNSAAQSHEGIEIPKSQLQSGDLVFFDTDGANDGHISHVGIYMGNGQFIQSSSSKRSWGIVITALEDPYYVRTYVKAARVLK
ncbi:cell wall hydrolase [Clostridia bacterium]|nr:cell wall hydrolase [Clostridia bacterium]